MDCAQDGAMAADQAVDVYQLCSEMREEVMSYRQELLDQREMLQAWTARLLSDMDHRTAELDLSLAGVSDNTGRHGKAISKLTEQQKRMSATLDAVVRAVKRLDRSRSPGRLCGNRVFDYGQWDASYRNTGSTPGSMPHVWGEGFRDDEQEQYEGQDFVDKAHEDMDNYAVEDAWDWPGLGEDGASPHIDKMRYYNSGSSNHDSIGRQWQQQWSIPPQRERQRKSGRSGGRNGHDVNVSCNGRIAVRAEAPQEGVANCVQGVLARIEEALTKLDSKNSPFQSEFYGGASASGTDGGGTAASTCEVDGFPSQGRRDANQAIDGQNHSGDSKPRSGRSATRAHDASGDSSSIVVDSAHARTSREGRRGEMPTCAM